MVFTFSFGVRVDYVAADLTKLEEIEALCQNILNIYPQGIDILVNNAGTCKTSMCSDVIDLPCILYI